MDICRRERPASRRGRRGREAGLPGTDGARGWAALAPLRYDCARHGPGEGFADSRCRLHASSLDAALTGVELSLFLSL